jgi:hypothetical protein
MAHPIPHSWDITGILLYVKTHESCTTKICFLKHFGSRMEEDTILVLFFE